jgi:TolB-like protein/Tfp pilus assembly protein PilF
MQLIGPFGFFTPSGTRIEISSRKSVALLALLAASPSGVRSRTWLQSMLWGSREIAQAQASLRRELSNLAQTLAGFEADHLLERKTQRVSLALDHIDIDMLQLGMEFSAARPSLRGDFLEGLDLRDCEEFEDWLRDERDRVFDLLALCIPEQEHVTANIHTIMGSATFDSRELLNAGVPTLPPKPSVAILPFDAIGMDANHSWLGVAIAEEVGLILSQFPQLFIVASTSSRALAEQRVDKIEIAHQLGVRYLLEGTVRKSALQLRASATLINGQTGEQIWGQSFDGDMTDLMGLQQDIANRIAPQIWSKVDMSERNRSLRHAPMSMDSYERYWRANALFRTWEKDSVLEAIVLTRQLLAQDPTCPWAASLAAFCLSIAYQMQFAADPAAAQREAISHFQTALRYGDNNVEVLGYCVGTLVYIGGDMAAADRLVAHSLSLLPSHPPTLFWGGWVDLVSGNPTRAKERFDLALRLNPASGVRSHTLTGIGLALLFKGEAANARLFLDEAVKTVPAFPLASLGCCIAAMLMGDIEAAEDAAKAIEGHNFSSFLALLPDPAQRQMLENMLGSVLLRTSDNAKAA